MKEKKAVLLLIPDDTSIEEGLCKEIIAKVSLFGRAKPTKSNNIYYEDNSKDNIFIKKATKNYHLQND